MEKEKYNGLSTRRTEVKSAPLLDTSIVELKVKTKNSTEPWVDVPEEDLDPLETSISISNFGN